MRLSPGHIKDLSTLVCKLKNHTEGVSKYVWRCLPGCVQEKLNGIGELTELSVERYQWFEHYVCNELNELLLGPSLYDAESFKDVRLSGNTNKLLERVPRGDDLLKLNRLLLEAAYESEILKSSTFKESATVRESSARRPRLKQLLWVYEVENGIDQNRWDYERLLDGVKFPLLPCEVDPDLKDTLTVRLGRVLEGLRKIEIPRLT